MREDVPWALHPGDDLDKTPFERIYGVAEEDLPAVDAFWDGNLLYTQGSGARSVLEQQGLEPQHAIAYEASPGVLYVAMNGVTLTGPCPSGGETANAAKKCSALVDAETSFPAAGGASQQAALFNQLADYYEPFDIVLTTSEPPEWMPYTMAVIGGSAGNADQPDGVCGVANVQCDGLRRNHVSLTFPGSCGGSAATAAQETAHNWGLEHTDNTTDLLYPYNTGGFKTFVDDCMDISHATGNGVTQCDYIHEEYCPLGGGEQQNTYQELLGVFGPRTPDSQAPSIVEMSPADGAVFTTADSFTVSARIEENSNFVAVRWELQGGETTLTRCSNNVCDQDFNTGVGFDPNGVDWDFTTLTMPPAGEYTFTFEVLDAYGGYDTQSVTVTVNEAGGSESGDPAGSSTGDETGGPIGGTGDDTNASDPGSDSTPGGNDEGGDDDDDGAATDSAGGSGDEGGGGEGCACSHRSPGGRFGTQGFLALMLSGLTLRRRRVA